MTQPLVTIIIPCYNAAPFVGEAIESALAQTYASTEVIVIDDGSTDETVDVLRSFGDRIRWETGPNRGACAARNRGIELARGEWVQFLDADDLLDPEKLAVQMPISHAEPTAIVYCDHRRQSLETGQVLATTWNRLGEVCDPVLFVLRGALQTSAPIHRRADLNQVAGFREDLPCSQEWDLHLRLAISGKTFKRISQNLYTMRSRDGSLSSDPIPVYRQFPRILWPLYRELETQGRLTEEYAQEFAATLSRAGRALVRLNRDTEAAELLAQARQMHASGGLTQVYSREARMLMSLVGPVWAERALSAARRLCLR